MYTKAEYEYVQILQSLRLAYAAESNSPVLTINWLRSDSPKSINCAVLCEPKITVLVLKLSASYTGKLSKNMFQINQ